MEKIMFDVGYGIEVESLHCRKCGFNVTEDKKLNLAIKSLKEQMQKEIKVISIGAGLGVRFPNNVVNAYKLKKGIDIMLKPEIDGIKLVLGYK